MPHADFVHLRVHSQYSLSEGALRIKDLVAACRRMRMPAVAVTDTANMFGALEFSAKAAEAGIQPIVGCQMFVHLGEETGRPKTPDKMVLLAQNELGYRNLMRLVSAAYLDSEPGDPPALAIDALTQDTTGLLALAGPPDGPLGRLLLAQQRPAAEALLGRLAEAFPGRLYIELQRHGLAAEDQIEGALLDLAERLDLPLVATNDCYFAAPELYEAHDALLCIAEGRFVAERDRRRVTPHHAFKSASDMRALFADLPEAVDNTLVIARRCAVMAERRDPILPPFETDLPGGEAEALQKMATSGLAERLATHVYSPEMDTAAREAAAAPYRERLERELGIINRMGYPGYFLIVADFIQWAKGQGIPVGPGRGSGAGSVVAWALTITDLDPIRFDLLFERFLNPERVSMPDFDVDFCQDRRDEVIRYVQQKYGEDRVAQIITFGTFQARAVLRDVGRVLQMPYGQVDKICKLVPHNPANPVTLERALESEPELAQQRDSDDAVASLITTGLKLEGLMRHASTHAAGVVIGDRPLTELVPLYRDWRAPMPATQFNMKDVEKAGLVKFDFLGLKTLTVLTKAVALIAGAGDGVIDLSTLPLDDPPTFAMLARADTMGVFQFESSGMRDALKRIRPDRFEDLIAIVALYRPGPMENIPAYGRRKHGEEESDYLHPMLQPVLEETYGIMIYQEQVMRVAQELAGFSLGHADLLRRAMGKKDKVEMAAQRQSFVDGAMKNDIAPRLAADIFDQVDKFAGYGFNKSHAAAYALVAYQTAYLKANHPVEFLAASMTLDQGTTDKLASYRQELDRLRIPLLPPDINRSEADFTTETTEEGTRGIRYALGALKNVGHGAMEALVTERRREGPFRTLIDAARRCGTALANRRQVENLARAGAFDCLVPSRHRALAGAEAIARAATASSTAETGQFGLFGEGFADTANELELPEVPDWSMVETLRQEFDAVGFYLSAHPLDSYASALERAGVTPIAGIRERLREGGGSRRLRLSGIVVDRKMITTRKGSRMCFLTISDATGAEEITLFAEVLGAARELITGADPILVSADGRLDGDELRLTGVEVAALDTALERTAAGLRIFLRDTLPLASLREIVVNEAPRSSDNGARRGRLSLVVDTEESEVELLLPEPVPLSAAVRGAIKAVPGIVDVRDM